MAATELVAIQKEKSEDPRFAVCYARGTTFKKEGNLFRVEKGQRNLVHRALCVVGHFKSRCRVCPHYDFTVTLRAAR